MSTLHNRQFRLIRRPTGLPRRDDFEFLTVPASEPGPGEILARVLYVSLDPAMRGWMSERRSYMPPVPLNDVMRAVGLGRVITSHDPRFAPGDIVTGLTGVQDYAVLNAAHARTVDPGVAPLPRFLSALGVTGLTAYFGLLEIGRPKPGETALVSAAAGATGSVVGQIAKIHGCRVVGVAGGPLKCSYLLNDLGFDAAIDYKGEDLGTALDRHCPEGVNIFFDNVGGDVLDLGLARLARQARVVLCGAISQYNHLDDIRGPKYYLSLLLNSARMEGFIVSNYMSRYGEAIEQIGDWMAQGKIKAKEDVVEGLEAFPETFLQLFDGRNSGKLMIKVAD